MRVFSQLMMRNKMKVEEMPLTVVGSPTITDGVVSGFDSNNKLQAPINNWSWNKIEYQFRIKFDSTSGYRVFVTDSKNIYGQVYNTNTIYIGYFDNTNTLKNLYQKTGTSVDTWVDVRVMLDKIANNGKVWINDELLADKTELNINNTTLGTTNIGNTFNGGSIDFNNSYIVIDGTKYIFTLPE